MSRDQLLNAIALFTLAKATPSVPPSPAVSLAGLGQDQFQAWLELEKAERQARLELERARLEIEERDLRAKRDLEQERLDVERARLAVEQERRVKEVTLREVEVDLLRRKAKTDGEWYDALISRTKQYVTVMKDVLWKFPADSAEIPGYFDHIENLFALYEVPDDIKSKVLQGQLHDKAKSLTTRLSRGQLDNYDELKEFLLKEFRVSPLKLRERFFALNKQGEETYTLLASKLKNTWLYYMRSRGGVDSVDKLVSLLCADRLKELLPRNCLDFVLAQEKDAWLNDHEVANAANTYMSCHYSDGNPWVSSYGGPKSWQPKAKPQFSKPSGAGKTGNSSDVPTGDAPKEQAGKADADQKAAAKSGVANPEPSKKEGPPRCFRCNKIGHIAKHCRSTPGEGKPARVNNCATGGETNNVLTGSSQTDVKSARASVQTQVSQVITDPPRSEGKSGENMHNDSCVDVVGENENIIVEELFARPYMDVDISKLSVHRALVDSGSEICCIAQHLVNDLNLPIVKQIRVSGLHGQSKVVDVVRLKVKPVNPEPDKLVNVAPPIQAWFAVIPDSNEEVIITPPVAEILNKVTTYHVVAQVGHTTVEPVATPLPTTASREYWDVENGNDRDDKRDVINVAGNKPEAGDTKRTPCYDIS